SVYTHVPDERRDQRRLPHPRRPGDSDRVRTPRFGVELADELKRERVAVLDQRDGACERPAVALANAGRERLRGPFPSPCHRTGLYVSCRPVYAQRAAGDELSTRPSAWAKNSFSSGVPTVTRIPPSAPNGPVGRTI